MHSQCRALNYERNIRGGSLLKFHLRGAPASAVGTAPPAPGGGCSVGAPAGEVHAELSQLHAATARAFSGGGGVGRGGAEGVRLGWSNFQQFFWRFAPFADSGSRLNCASMGTGLCGNGPLRGRGCGFKRKALSSGPVHDVTTTMEFEARAVMELRGSHNGFCLRPGFLNPLMVNHPVFISI